MPQSNPKGAVLKSGACQSCGTLTLIPQLAVLSAKEMRERYPVPRWACGCLLCGTCLAPTCPVCGKGTGYEEAA